MESAAKAALHLALTTQGRPCAPRYSTEKKPRRFGPRIDWQQQQHKDSFTESESQTAYHYHRLTKSTRALSLSR